EHGVAGVQGQPEVLAPAAYVGDRTPGHGRGEVGRAGHVPPHRARVQHVRRLDLPAGHVTGEPQPYGLDLRQLGHQPRAPLLAGRPASDPTSTAASLASSSGADSSEPSRSPSWSAVRARKAACAARCSASFFVRPCTPPCRTPATTAHAVNVLAWSGPVCSISYSGTPRPSVAVS